MVILLLVYTPTYSHAVEIAEGKVTAKALNIRSGPGLSYDKVDVVYKGEYVSIQVTDDMPYETGEADGYVWEYVLTPNGIYGYCAIKYLEISGP
ncbi:SH3 domain-containing protein [Vallitalea pronyensis]|uniref:SH3 domain-containing protein n=1 Tax=Vallitalea pronyensis TaxID=1348613 RepID=A0A8J8MGH2_9FIRM|nr:SH3 domain-containing protein [Vallitalea pronyensis]QUI20798.1 SH3 domain-containing protein [Vallitalea pronyensis]